MRTLVHGIRISTVVCSTRTESENGPSNHSLVASKALARAADSIESERNVNLFLPLLTHKLGIKYIFIPEVDEFNAPALNRYGPFHSLRVEVR
jgi:hypothetical protein